jgi:DNA-binding HxlR family transcriptional regulator
METLLVNALKAKPLRFGQLLRALSEASRKVATEQLHELDREGIISRTSFGNRWERVEYF